MKFVDFISRNLAMLTSLVLRKAVLFIQAASYMPVAFPYKKAAEKKENEWKRSVSKAEN